MVLETFEEIKSDLGMLKAEIQEKNGNVDAILVGSWVDKLVIILQKMTETLGVLDQRLETISKPQE